MTEQVLLSILDKLGKDVFERFKWHLEHPKDSQVTPIPKSKLEDAKRTDTVDLMVQTYKCSGAMEVTKKILETINRNDLVQELEKTNPTTKGLRDAVQAGDAIPAEERLTSVRTQFVNRVSRAVLNQLLDKLLEQHVINDAEVDSVRTEQNRQDKAREVIDMVRRKGTDASSVLITALREVDPSLYKELNLS